VQRTRAVARRPVSAVSEDKTRFIRFAKAGCNKGERSQMVTSGLGFGGRGALLEGGGNGSERCFVAARNRNGHKKGLTGEWA